MKADSSMRWIEVKAPTSRISRAREKVDASVCGVGIKAEEETRWIFAEERIDGVDLWDFAL